MPPWTIDLLNVVFSTKTALWAATLVGVMFTHIYSFSKKTNNTLEFLKKVLPADTSERAHLLIDFAVNLIIGTIIGSIIYSPQNAHEALAAGVTWSAGVNLLKREKR